MLQSQDSFRHLIILLREIRTRTTAATIGPGAAAARLLPIRSGAGKEALAEQIQTRKDRSRHATTAQKAPCAASLYRPIKNTAAEIRHEYGHNLHARKDNKRMKYATKTDPVHRFYGTQQWKNARAAYWKHCGGLCEKCLAKGIIRPAEQIHHIKPLRPEDLDNAALTTGFDNLQALCERCHEEEHNKFSHGGRYRISEDGSIEIL